MKTRIEKSAEIRPMNDVAFRFTFGRETTKQNLCNLLNAILEAVHREPIKQLTLKGTELTPERFQSKSCRLDILAVTETGEQINVEVQVTNRFNMARRSLFYWSKLFTSQLVEGDNYQELTKTIAINITEFVYIDNDRVHNVFHLREAKTSQLLTDVLEIHFIELPKLSSWVDLDSEKSLTEWLLFLKGIEDPEILEVIMMKNPAIRQAYQDLQALTMDAEAWEMYEARERALRDERSMIYGAKEEGRHEGRQEGRQELLLETIMKMLQKRMPDDLILDITGITKEELEQYRQRVASESGE